MDSLNPYEPPAHAATSLPWNQRFDSFFCRWAAAFFAACTTMVVWDMGRFLYAASWLASNGFYGDVSQCLWGTLVCGLTGIISSAMYWYFQRMPAGRVRAKAGIRDFVIALALVFSLTQFLIKEFA